jgi:MinD-like ATPase involved in chromosome partitioning or flagellar assembly
MTLRVATVLSAQEWEPRLVSHARETAELRIVLRAFQPDEIEERSDEIDIVVAGAEVAWVTPAQIGTWQRMGLNVVGVHPRGDGPAAAMLDRAGVDELVPDDTDAESLITAIRFLAPRGDHDDSEIKGVTAAVIGARGAPGTTEVALGLALNAAAGGKAVLIDLDLDAPSVAIRLGLAPRPDITDVADVVRATGAIDDDAIHRVGSLDVVTGSHRTGESVVRPAMVEDVIEVAAAHYQTVVLDLGAAPPDDHILKRADDAVLVVDGSAVGVVRAAKLVAEWSGPPPRIVINRAARHEHQQLTEAVLHWTGIEPDAVIEDRRAIRTAALAARVPDRHLLRALAAVSIA